MSNLGVSVVGVVGVPGRYGGFETLAENIVKYWFDKKSPIPLSVYCSSRGKSELPPTYLCASLRYLPVSANGPQSVLFDFLALIFSVLRREHTILLLGVSGASILPIIRLISSARVVTNIDGIEWQRTKWRGFARAFLRFSEWAAVRYSHVVVADNQAIADYVTDTYGASSVMIPYGGDQAIAAVPDISALSDLPGSYALALCRIEPENNVAMILDAFSRIGLPLVFVGNWNNSVYGRELRGIYGKHFNIFLLDPIYDQSKLYAIRSRATIYIHGHSAGGTNPSLVEMMHFSIPVLAHACIFNRKTTEDKARYFLTSDELVEAVKTLTPPDAEVIGAYMGEIARRRYTWDRVGRLYFDLLSVKG